MEAAMKIRNCMTSDVHVASPEQTIAEAAGMMAKGDIGAVLVGQDDRLVGMITDRDIVIRALAAGKGPATSIGEVMSRDVKYCYDDQDLGDVAATMADLQIRRLPVLSRDKRLVGVIALGDIARH